MRILHTADWHLGKVLFEEPLLDDQRQVLSRIVALAASDPHDLLVVAGDVFDRCIPPEEAVTELGRWLTTIREAAPAMPVVIISGNHDSGARLGWSSGLLSRTGVHVRGGVEDLEVPIRICTSEGEHAEVWPVPFLWPGAIASAGREAGGQASAFAAAIAVIHDRQTSGHTQVLVAHCFTAGELKTSDSERMLVGQAAHVDPALLEGFDYAALGHLHRTQRAASNAWYSGSLLPYAFSEVDAPKAVLSVEVRSRREPKVVLHPIAPPRAMRVLTGELEDLLDSPAYEPFREDYLSVVLTRPVLAGQPMALLRSRFPHVLQLVNPVEIRAAGHVPGRDQAGVREDLEADFLDFERHLRQGPPPDDVLLAFRRLRSRLQEGAR